MKRMFRLPEGVSLGPFTGLRARIVLLLAAVTALIVVLFGFVVSSVLQHYMIQQKRAQGRAALLAIQANLDLSEGRGAFVAHAGELPQMRALVTAMVNNLELSNLTIVNPEQAIVGASRPDTAGLVLADPDLARAMKDRKLIHRVIGLGSDNPEVIFAGPLYQGGAILGAARFSLPLTDMLAAMSNARRFVLLYALMDAAAIILIGSLILWRLIVKPIDALVAATERLTGGDYRFAPAAPGRGEIGRLSRALGKLASTLRDRDAVGRRQLGRLERINQDLQVAHDQLKQSDRLAYLGRIAAGVAHEIGNPLGAIYGYLEILRDLDLTPADRDVLERLGKEIERIDRTMRGLLDFSRVRPAEPTPLDVLAVAAETTELMKRQRGLDHVALTIAASDGLPPARLDATQFRQMVLNILLNAADAMGGRGAIRLEADAAPYERSLLMEARLPDAPSEAEAPFTDLLRRGIVFSEPYGPAPGAPTVRLHVTDTGPGMAADVLGRLFDPFFTTKPPGKGTGLGMALCREMAASAGGLIRVESRPGVGTCVSLIFPAAERDEQTG